MPPLASARLAALALATLLVAPLEGCRRKPPIGVMSPPPSLRVDAGARSFLVLGDWGRRGSYEQRRVAGAMDSTARRLGAAFVVVTGDNFYPNGVRGTDDPAWATSFERVYSGASLQVPWYAVLGNHDYRGRTQAQIDYTARSPRWKMPARHYAVRQALDDSTSLELFFLDTSPYIAEYHDEPRRYDGITRQDTSAQRRWLDSALVASRATWKVVVGHHHVYSGGKRDTNDDLAHWLVPILERRGVVAYLSGHEHVLQHVVRPGGRVHYFISGAGSEVRGPGDAVGTRYSEGRPGFLAVSVLPRSLLVQAIDFRGAVRYATELSR